MSEYLNPGVPGMIDNVHIYGLDESIRASKFPMAVDLHKLTPEPTERTFKLGNADRGSGHDNFLKGIIVQFDLTFTNKVWVEAERYHWFDIVSSQSTMHRIASFDLDDQYIEYVDPRMIEIMKEKVDTYNRTKEPDDYLRVLYSNPCGFRLTAGMSTNYCQLKTMRAQREFHGLPEWPRFCGWSETLPMFKELCLGEGVSA